MSKLIYREMCKKMKSDHTNKWHMHNPASGVNSYGISIYKRITLSRPETSSYNTQQKKTTCKIVDFAVQANHRIKLKESEKKDKYLDLARELKKLWNMKMTIIPIVIGVLGTLTKCLLKGLEDLEVGKRVESIQTAALLRTARILRRVLETWGDFLSLKLQWKTTRQRWFENI